MKDWTLLETERAIFRTINLATSDVAWQQVGCELNSLKISFYSISKFFNCSGLGKTRSPLHNEVSPTNKCDHQSFYQTVLTNNFQS